MLIIKVIIYIVFNVIICVFVGSKFIDVVFMKVILNMFSFRIIYVNMLLTIPWMSLYITRNVSFILVLLRNVCIWNIIISELKESRNDVAHSVRVGFNVALDSILIPLEISNIPVSIPL